LLSHASDLIDHVTTIQQVLRESIYAQTTFRARRITTYHAIAFDKGAIEYTYAAVDWPVSVRVAMGGEVARPPSLGVRKRELVLDRRENLLRSTRKQRG
jgi:hypothetical protein